jgi:hypothetical protein
MESTGHTPVQKITTRESSGLKPCGPGISPGPLSFPKENHMLDIAKIEEIIASSEPLESFEIDDYTDQEEIMSALQEMLDRELY